MKKIFLLVRDANILAVEKEIVHLTFTEKCENKLKTKQKNSQSQRNFLFFFFMSTIIRLIFVCCCSIRFRIS